VPELHWLMLSVPSVVGKVVGPLMR
jgi:hypothetical protein